MEINVRECIGCEHGTRDENLIRELDERKERRIWLYPKQINLKLDDDVLNIPLFMADQADRLLGLALEQKNRNQLDIYAKSEEEIEFE